IRVFHVTGVQTCALPILRGAFNASTNRNQKMLPYAVYALTGSIFWFLFVDALNAPLRQLNSNRSMLNRVNFPPEALILSGIGQRSEERRVGKEGRVWWCA